MGIVANAVTIDATTFPDQDEWLYLCDIDVSAFSPSKAYIQDGHRIILQIDIGGIVAFRKWDKITRSKFCNSALRDKIAADLAQILGVNIPATLMWREGADLGCVQKAPPNQFAQTMEMYLKACQVAKKSKPELDNAIARAYDPENFYFDVWVANHDRSYNMRNLLISETSSVVSISLIDYNCALGHKEKPWPKDSQFNDSGFLLDNPPIPHFLKSNEVFLQQFHEAADRIDERFSKLGEEVIHSLCERAGSFYRQEDVHSMAKIVSNGLIERRKQTKSWAQELLKL